MPSVSVLYCCMIGTAQPVACAVLHSASVQHIPCVQCMPEAVAATTGDVLSVCSICLLSVSPSMLSTSLRVCLRTALGYVAAHDKLG